MIKRSVRLLNRSGLHARPASIFVRSCQQYRSEIWIQRGEERINAKSIMNILAMGVTYDTELLLIIDGEDEQEAMEELTGLFERNFD